MVAYLSRRKLLARAVTASVGGAGVVLLAACQAAAPAAPTAAPSAPAPTQAPSAAPTQAPAAAAAPKSSGPIEITWSTTPLWPRGKNSDKDEAPPEEWANDAIERYKKVDPNVNITLEVVTWDQWSQKYQTAIASQSWWNVMYRMGADIALAEKGVTVPLDDVVTKEDREEIGESWWKPFIIKGKLYEWPIFGDPAYLAINRSMFKEKGAEKLLPSEDTREWTWDQFLDAAKTVSGGSGASQTYALGLPGDQRQYWTMGWIPQSFGARLWNEDETRSLIDQPEYVEGVEFMLAMQDTHKVIPPGIPSYKDIDQFFLDKRVAAEHRWGSIVQTIKSGLGSGSVKGPWELYLVNQPYKKGITSKVGHSGESLGYSVMQDKDERKVAASKQFIRWLGFPENKAGWTQRGFMPARATARKGVYADDPNLKWAAEVLLQKPYEDHPIRLSKNAAAGKLVTFSYFQETIGGAFQEVMLKKKPVKQALGDAAKRINDDIAKAMKAG